VWEQARTFQDQAGANAWLADTFGRWADTLPSAEHDALASYKGEDYRPLNAALRAERALSNHQARQVALLDSALGRFALPEPVIVYRGFHLAGRAILGAAIQDLAYFSTSLLPEHAEGFLKLPAQQPLHPTLARVLLPAGTHCGAPDLIEYLGELEILLPSGTRFQIRSAQQPSKELRHGTVDLQAIQ
jgi:ADP-ribosyltransferase exoenzyme